MTINHIYLDMSKSDNSANQSPEYFLDTSNLTKIWFSKDPNHFMDLVRMDNLRQALRDNPNSKITLVHGDLKGEGLKSMMGFCEHHNKYRDKKYHITPVHVDELIEDAGCDELDIKYNNLIRQELKLWREEKGGNPAAASDMLRYTGKILAYSDCDAGIKSDGKRHPMKGPIGIPMLPNGSPNNDVMMMAVNQDGVLHKDAAALLRKMREDVVETSKILVKLKQDYQDHPKTHNEPNPALDPVSTLRSLVINEKLSIKNIKRLVGNIESLNGRNLSTHPIFIQLADYISTSKSDVNLPSLRHHIQKYTPQQGQPQENEHAALLDTQIQPLMSHTGPEVLFRVIHTAPGVQAYRLQESGSFQFCSQINHPNSNQLSWVPGQEHRVAKPNQELATKIIGNLFVKARARLHSPGKMLERIATEQRQKRFEGAKNFWEKRVHQNPAPPQGRGSSSR